MLARRPHNASYIESALPLEFTPQITAFLLEWMSGVLLPGSTVASPEGDEVLEGLFLTLSDIWSWKTALFNVSGPLR